jgi:hypothetical protein
VTSSDLLDDIPSCAVKNVLDLGADSIMRSTHREKTKDIPHARNNWACYDLKERRTVTGHYAVRTWNGLPGPAHLSSWLVETSADGKERREINHREDSKALNGRLLSARFAVAGAWHRASSGS